jgi:hypothetical protein
MPRNQIGLHRQVDAITDMVYDVSSSDTNTVKAVVHTNNT